MRVYISGRITDNPDYKKQFEDAEIWLETIGHKPLNPAKLNQIMDEEEYTHEDYMRIDLAMLGLCNAIYMLNGWNRSMGANQEYGYALGKGLKIVFENMSEENIIKTLKG